VADGVALILEVRREMYFGSLLVILKSFIAVPTALLVEPVQGIRNGVLIPWVIILNRPTLTASFHETSIC
jgi:hypothetical protein